MAEATITARSRAAAAGGSARGSSATSGNAGESTLKGRGAAPGSTTKVSGNGHKGLRAVTSESWDDDFLFQHSSTSDLHLPMNSAPSRPRTPSSRTPSSSRSVSSSSPAPSTPSRLAPPSPRPWLRPNANPSLDSLAFSAWGSEDPDPTLTHLTPIASTSTSSPTFPALSSQQTTPRRSSAQDTTCPRSSRPTARRLDYSQDDYRSNTPSLSSTTGAVTAEELTEAESYLSDCDDDAGARTSVEIEGARANWARPKVVSGKERPREGRMDPPPLPPPSSRREASGGGSKKWKTTLGGVFGGGAAGQRTGPREVLPATVVGQTGQPSSPGAAPGHFVVLGRRTRGSGSTEASQDASQWRRRPHSSLESNASSNATSGSSLEHDINHRDPSTSSSRRPRRLSLDFLYSSKRKSSSSSQADGPPLSPSASYSFNLNTASESPPTWREYEETTSGGEGGETTSAGEESGLSGDEAMGRVVGGGGKPRRGILSPSTSFTGTMRTASGGSSAPAPQGRWTGSQVSFASFASSAGAFGLHAAGNGTGSREEEEEAPERRRRKLVRRRAGEGESPSMEREEAEGGRPLLSASSSLASASGTSASRSASLEGSFHQQQEDAMAFARDPEDETKGGRRQPTGARMPNGRLRSATAGSFPASSYRGSVIELESDADGGWLAVAPFNRSSSTSVSPSASTSPLSKSTSTSPAATVRKLLRRRSSSRKPPVTGKTQAALRAGEKEETKEKKRPPLSLRNILSRSASSLPLVDGAEGNSRRAPSPAPTTHSGKSSILTRGKRSTSVQRNSTSRPVSPTPPTPQTPQHPPRRSPSVRSPAPTTSTAASAPTPRSARLLHRHSASVETPKAESTFLSRARAFSKPAPPSPPVVSNTTASDPAFSSKRTHRTSMQSIASFKGRLNEGWTMPGAQRPQSTVSMVSDVSEASTVRASPFLETRPAITVSNGSWGKRAPSALGTTSKGHRPSLSLSSVMPSRSTSYAPSPSAQAGEHEAEQLGAAYPRPRTAMAVDRPGSNYFEDGAGDGTGLGLVRRNSLSDLRIPSRITSSQARIEEDLERVKEFAKGIDDLKTLRQQYQQLIKTALTPPYSPELGAGSSSPADQDITLSISPSSEAIGKMALGIRRIEIDYQSWWEQAEALVDLGDGKPRAKEPKESPGVAASKRDRCVSLAPSTPRKIVAAGSETETEETQRRAVPPTPTASSTTSRAGSMRRPRYERRPSASSIETGLSVEERQKEMLRGVLLNPALKGASLPSRGPPSPRPGLAILTEARTTSLPAKPLPLGLSSSTHSPHPQSSSAPNMASPSKGNIRRVSRAGVSGIKDFLLRLRLKASEELAASVNTPQLNHLARDARTGSPSTATSKDDGRRSVSDPTRSLTPSSSRYGSLRRRQPGVGQQHTPPPKQRWSRSSSDEEEDWDKESSPPSAVGSVSHRGTTVGRAGTVLRTRTQSSAAAVAAGGAERMVLTTEAMPSLLLKVREVQERCEECVGRLKGLTV